jgi:hypothetical protein
MAQSVGFTPIAQLRDRIELVAASSDFKPQYSSMTAARQPSSPVSAKRLMLTSATAIAHFEGS